MDVKCVICGDLMRHYDKDLWVCQKCSLFSSNLKPDVSLYDKSYVVKYGSYENTKLGKHIQATRLLFVRRWATEGKLLDFGCGVGSFVKACHGAVGFDINPYSDYCNIGTLFDKYHIVTFWDCLEHLTDPVKIIKGLNPEYLFVCTPSTDDSKTKLTEWRHYMPGEHVHYFNESSLRALLDKCGYEVFEVNYDESELRRGGGPKNILSMGGALGKH